MLGCIRARRPGEDRVIGPAVADHVGTLDGEGEALRDAGGGRPIGAVVARRGPIAASGIEVLLVTSRASRRWIAPKDWPMKGRKPHRAAAIEAREEAGVVGRIGKEPAGHYTNDKRRPDGGAAPCRVAVYVLTVTVMAMADGEPPRP